MIFRSVFAAFVWHEGIVHDAMAVASYLKFHPNITKQGNPQKEEKNTKVKNCFTYIFYLSLENIKLISKT